MRFLFLTNFYPPADLGGWEQWCQEIAVEFRRRGHDVAVLTSRFRRETVQEIEPSIHRELYLESDLEYYQPLDFFTKLRARDRANERCLSEAVAKIKPDLVFIWGMWQLNSQLAVIAETLCPKRVVYYFCGLWPIAEEERNPHTSYWSHYRLPVGWLALKMLARRRSRKPNCHDFACVSQYILQTYERYGFRGGRVIYGGIDTKAFARPAPKAIAVGNEAPGPLRLLFAGTISHEKGVDTAVKAMVHLAQRYDHAEVQLSVVGYGHPGFVSTLEGLIERENITAYVTFHGRVPKEQMAGLFHEHDVLLFTSTWEEPLARMMMEGLAAGVAVISTPTGGSPEAITHGKNGLLFETGSALDLAAKIQLLLDQPHLARELAAAGRQTAVTRFDFQRMAGELEAYCAEQLAI